MRLHVLFHVGLLREGSAADDALERLLSGVTAQRPEFRHDSTPTNKSLSSPAAADSPPDVLLQVKVFGKGLDAVVALQFGPFTFQLLCWTEATDFSLLGAFAPMRQKANSRVPPQVPATPSRLFLLLLERLGIMTFSKSVSSVRLLVILQSLVLVPCLPGL